MSELYSAFFIWLPLGTIVPLFIARVTGSDWRGSMIEASLFATLGLIIFPILIALVGAAWTRDPNVTLIFAASFVLAFVCSLIFRRLAAQGSRSRHRS